MNGFFKHGSRRRFCLLAGAAYGSMYALATWYNPKPREITVSIPPDRFTKQH